MAEGGHPVSVRRGTMGGMTDTTPVIEVRDFTMRFGDNTVVDRL